MSPFYKTFCFKIFFLAIAGSLSISYAFSQSAYISGANCVVPGTPYQYMVGGSFNSSWAIKWCVSGGGTINSIHNGCQSGTGYAVYVVSITWDASPASHYISLTYNGNSTSLTVTNASTLVAGTISNTSQSINYNTVPVTLSCSAASGGSCGAYTIAYQWQQSDDNVNWNDISGATSQNFSPGVLMQTSYYRRSAVSQTNTAAYSNTATIIVYPQLNAGAVSPSSQAINYNSVPAALTLSGVSGGSGSYTYQWQKSPDNINWTAISGATAATYSPPALTATTYYRVSINGGSGYSTVATVTVAPLPPVVAGTLTPAYIQINSGTRPGAINGTMPSGGNCGGNYTYQWQSSANGVNFTNISGATSKNYTPDTLTANTWYRRTDICSTQTAYTDTCQVVVGAFVTDINFIRVRDITKPGVPDSVAATTLASVYDVAQTTQYFDGLGRPVETVAMQQSPLQKDLVSFSVYDPLGREANKFLPYVATTSDGNYKPTAQADEYSFNATQFTGEQYYYSQTNFEPSPLNRVAATYAPGSSWVGSARGVSVQYALNTAADSVRYWKIAFAPGSLPATTSTYAGGTLYKNITTDEAGHSVVEYKDMEGKAVLKKVQLAASPGTAHAGWLCTYYIYDDLNHLRFVIQPLGVQLINANWTITTAIANELCFRYEYDYRGRMIIKKMPGAGEARMVYDLRDRLVMSQDSSLRLAQKWMFIKYDDENRPDSTGLITDNTNYNNLAYHQNLAGNSIAYPNVASYTNELLTQTYYDDYNWVAGSGSGLGTTLVSGYPTNSTYFYTTNNVSPAYSQPITQFNITRGMPTGSKTKVIGTASQFLYSVNLYDDRGRVIQTQSVNYTGGMDTTLNQYSFDGKLLRTLFLGRKSGANAQSHKVLTKMNYDAGGRLLTVYKNIDNAAADQLIATNTYNELGQLSNKQLGNNLENLAYAYNIRGWLTSINKNYIAGTGSSYFGMELGYDKTTSAAGTTSYTSPEYNGNIEGTIWRSKGDGINRKYDFTYDNANRLTAASFLQNTTGSAWDNSYLNFTTNNLSYDANGNILTMNQYGFKVNGSALIDQLIYTYQTNSNKLSKVNDVVNDPLSKLGDFHYSGTKQATDYSYDGNGNLISDNNKAISGIVYNYLNLPQNVTVTAKGSITYTYDAGGNKLAKTTVDNTVVPSKTTTTLYMGGFIYQNDTLQFISHEEGRARWAFHRYLNGSTNYKWEYDYFLKDHLGNTRMVLTQEKDTSQYIATMEAAYRATENRLFYNIPATSYARSAVSGYPTDNTTVPNDSLARVNGNGPKTGPSILLKVMSGDVIDVATKSFYKSGGTVNSPNSILTDVLNSLAGGIVTATSASHGVVSDLTNTSTSPIYAALNSFLPTNDPNTTGKPKAYLNWILLNDQFQGVNTYPQSGAIPVGGADVLNTLAYTGIPITKNGYLYIWVSNETPGWDVFFDNLSVKQYSGAITEETHYYPFGLSMAGISDKALNNSPENKYKYNKGSELQNKEFSDGSGLELYSTFYRSLDPQLGRFWQIDPKPNPEFSLYAAMQNNPISFNDVLGDSIIGKANNAIANRIVTKATNQMTKNANTINDNNKKIDAAKAKIAAGATGKDLKKANSAMNSLNKKNDELQNRNDRLNTGINAIGKMRADVDHNYSFTSPANDDGTHHVTQGEGKNVLVEGSNDGLFFHESVHVLQSLNTGGLNFSTNESTKGYLLNDASTGTYIGDEVQAYQVEFSYDGSFSNSNASNLNDINNDSVRGLHDGDYYPYQNLK